MKWRSHKHVWYRNTNFFKRWVITIENSCLSLLVLSIPAVGSSRAASLGTCLLQGSTRQEKQLSLPWKHHFPGMHHNAGIRQIQPRPPLCTGGIHTAITISPKWAVPHQHPQSNGQELGRSVSAGSHVLSWWVHVQNSKCAFWVTTHSWLTGIACLCVYVAHSMQWVTPAIPANLHSLHTEQETQPPAASSF